MFPVARAVGNISAAELALCLCPSVGKELEPASGARISQLDCCVRGGPNGSDIDAENAGLASVLCSARLGGGIVPTVKEELAPEPGPRLVPVCVCVLRLGPVLVLPRTQTMASGYLHPAPRPRLTQFRHVGRLSSHYTGFF